MSTHRILFVGNSHTYLHYMPRLLVRLAEAAGHKISVDQATGEGASLEWHWTSRETREKLATGTWTHVVLQERSRGSLEEKTLMYHHARLLDNAIRGINARTIFYMTWAATDKPEDQRTIANAYKEITRECGAMLAPVGQAWELSMSRNPELALHHKDGRHASKIGAYLTACVFYSLLFESSPEGLTGVIEKDDRLPANLRIEEERILQRAAHDAISSNRLQNFRDV